MKPRPPSEKQLQTMILDYWRGFGRPGTRVFAVPNARAFGQPGLTKGIPDLACYGGKFLNGRTLYLELKVGKNKLSDYQEIILAEMRAAKVPHAVVRSFEEAEEYLTAWMICKPIARAA